MKTEVSGQIQDKVWKSNQQTEEKITYGSVKKQGD